MLTFLKGVVETSAVKLPDLLSTIAAAGGYPHLQTCTSDIRESATLNRPAF
jgi:hypothetical protein